MVAKMRMRIEVDGEILPTHQRAYSEFVTHADDVKEIINWAFTWGVIMGRNIKEDVSMLNLNENYSVSFLKD